MILKACILAAVALAVVLVLVLKLLSLAKSRRLLDRARDYEWYSRHRNERTQR